MSLAGVTCRFLVVVATLGVAGCGAGGQTITIPSPDAAGLPTATQATTTATAATPTSNYPVVHWTDDPWPFTLQLVSITTSTEGYAGLGSAPPQWDWMMVEVNITNQSPGRTPPTPELELRCSGPGSATWNPNTNHGDAPMQHGYVEEPGSNQLTQNSYIGLAYGVPQTYGAEWEVPEGTNTSEVTCAISENNGQLLNLH